MHSKTLHIFLENIFKYYNKELFKDQLPEVVLNLAQTGKTSGFFTSKKWKDNHNREVHEISLNPDFMSEKYGVEFHQTLVHEMVHLWQEINGKAGRLGYHNKQWSKKMTEIGLQPTDNGTANGKPTGETMTDLVIDGGNFEKAYQKLQEQRFAQIEVCKTISGGKSITFEPVKKPNYKYAGKRSKYSCNCPANLWGKSGLKITCNACKAEFKEN